MSRTWEPPRQQAWTGHSTARSPYTIEGVIDGLGDFARGTSRARGWRRWVAKGLALCMVGPFIAAVAFLVGYALFELVRVFIP